MDGYLIWLVFLTLAILSISIIQLQAGRSGRLQRDCRQMQTNVHKLQDQLRERETRLDRLQRGNSQLLKLKTRARDLEDELKRTKHTMEYKSAERLRYLEDYTAHQGATPAALFLGTFPPRGLHSIESHLARMLENARFEVIVVSPWIKRQMWDRIAAPLHKFSRQGGRLVVFMRGCESDYNSGMSDDIRNEVESLAGEILFVPSLHAKIYVVDRREAIVTSANLSKGGIDDNYEAGIWLNDPNVLKDICAYIDDLRQCRQP
ncbi:MAG TPA: phospholipase D-like domain-containing protein [Methanothrix sp.]